MAVEDMVGLPLGSIRVVMVNTTHPGNIGAAARAMKTMGLSRLYLVKPERYPDAEATWRASAASDVLEQAVVTETLDEAIADCHLVMGASARTRRIPWPMLVPSEAGALAVNEAVHGKEIALVFGREARGLTNDELQQCQYHMSIPANEQYGVLNVAAAIQIFTYEVRMAALKAGNCVKARDNNQPEMPLELTTRWDEDLATQQELNMFMQHCDAMLRAIHFYDPQNPRQLLTRLKRLFTRVRMDKLELNMMRGIFRAVEDVARSKQGTPPEN